MLSQADHQDLLLHEEQTEELKAEGLEELRRQAKSRAQRTARRARVSQLTSPSPPSDAELRQANVFIDRDVVLPEEWDSAVSKHQLRIVADVAEASIFVATNPWKPSTCISWAACLIGAWVLNPSVIVTAKGPCLKYKAALNTKRTIWVSAEFKQRYSRIWLTILEALNRHVHRWKLLCSAEAWVHEKALALKNKRSSEVLALVFEGARDDGKTHVFLADLILAFHPLYGW